MNLLDRILNKKFIFALGTIITATITAFYIYLTMDNLTNGLTLTVNYNITYSLVNRLKSVAIIFVIMAILIIFDATLVGIYYFKKSKEQFFKVDFIFFVIMAFLSLLALSGISAILKPTTPSAFEALYSSDIYRIEIALSIFTFICYMSIITFIYNIIIILQAKGTIPSKSNITFEESATTIKFNTSSKVNQPQYDTYSINANKPTTHAEYDLKTGELVEVGDDGNISSISSFFRGKGKIIILIILAGILAFGGYQIFTNNKTTIDLSKNMSVEYSGNNGNGTVKVKNNDIEYDKSDKEVSKFIDDISYTYSNQDKLKNGDKLTVTIIYNASEADRLDLKVTGTTKTFIVKGLPERYEDASEVPDDLYNKVIELVKKEAEKDYANSSLSTYEYNQDSVYFARSVEGDGTDAIMVVYKVTRTFKISNYSGTSTYYDCYEVYNINSNSLANLSKKKSILSLSLMDKDFLPVKDPAKIEEGLKQKKTNATFSKFEK